MQGEPQYVVYLDVFFLINFLMDAFILWVTGRWLKVPGRSLHILLGACIGGIYSVVTFTPLFSNSWMLQTGNICVAGLMSKIAIPANDVRQWMKNTIQLYIITFIAGGIVNMLYYATNMGVVLRSILYASVAGNSGFTILEFISITLILYFLLSVIGEFLMYRRKQLGHIYKVRLSYQGKEITCNALLDTGNSLRLPETGEPVHLAEQMYMRSVLGISDEKLVEKYEIPYQAVGTPYGILEGIRMDGLVVEKKTLHRPIIAIYRGTLSAEGKFHMILNSEVFDMEESYEREIHC